MLGDLPRGPSAPPSPRLRWMRCGKSSADAKAKGLVRPASRQEVEATLDEPLPQSMWDDLQGRVLAAVQAKQLGNADGEKSALAEIAATRAKLPRPSNATTPVPLLR